MTNTRKYHSKISIGIDPASQGAVAFLIKRDVTAVLLWKKVTRKKKKVFKIDYSDGNQVITSYSKTEASSLVKHILNYIDENTHVEIAIEDSYIGRNRNIAGTINLAKFSGGIASCLEYKLNTECLWVKANEWRNKVLGLKYFTKRIDAKNASLKMIPKLVNGLDVILNMLGEHDHITDAVGVSLWLQQS